MDEAVAQARELAGYKDNEVKRASKIRWKRRALLHMSDIKQAG